MNEARKSPWSWFKSDGEQAENRLAEAQPPAVSESESTADEKLLAKTAEPTPPDPTTAILQPPDSTAETFPDSSAVADTVASAADDDFVLIDESADDDDDDVVLIEESDDLEQRPRLEPPPTARQAPFDPQSRGESWPSLPRRTKKNKSLSKPELPRAPLTPEQKLLLLDTWSRSGLPARDFGALVGISKHTLYSWKQRFEKLGPAGLMEQKRGVREGSRLPDLTKRAILLMKEAHPDWGCQRISDMLTRGPALPASASAVARVLHEAGYQMDELPTKRHPDRVRSFERARPCQLWQTDLFTFVLKRQNRRVYLVAFMDDHSRFITGYGLHATQSAALVIEVLRSALAAYGPPEEILTDNGAQYVTWRGKSQFNRELEKRGIRQIVAKPRRPQTLGKIERFWGTLWRECLEAAIFIDLDDARQRIGLFIDWYNFQRPHQGVDGLVPADRFFDSAPEVLQTLKARVADNALELARNGVPRKPFYLTGQVDGKPFSVHREGDRVILHQAGEAREEIDLAPTPEQSHQPQSPADQLPPALTPDGSPRTAWNPPGAELPPGISPLDASPSQPSDESEEPGGVA
jgi:transposase InsO family protein